MKGKNIKRHYIYFFVLCLLGTTMVRSQNKDAINVKDFGALGNGVHDDSKAILLALNTAISKNKTCFIPKTNNFYKINQTLKILLPIQGNLRIVSNGAIIKPDSNYYKSSFLKQISTGFANNVIFDIRQTSYPKQLSDISFVVQNHQTSLSIVGLKIYGPDKFFSMFPTSGIDKIWVGIQCGTDEVTIKNCEFNNIYGYGIQNLFSKSINISNVIFNSVGGRGKTTSLFSVDNDSFGDAIYNTFLQKNAIIQIDNCTLIGYQSKYRSRIGITFEYNQDLVNAIITNCHFEHYAKGIHHELCHQIKLNINNCTFSDFNYALAAVQSTQESSIDIHQSKFYLTNSDGADPGGPSMILNRDGGKLEFNNCLIDMNNPRNSCSPIVGVNSFTNCTFNGHNKNPCFTGGSTAFDSCIFKNMGGNASTFYSNGKPIDVHIDNSTFIDCAPFKGDKTVEVKLLFLKPKSNNSLNFSDN
ncbi:MAG: hypothetical protein PW786_07935 [Arachidicoccus sp.]|nr:hypothetical protein [Arachidicoccus sp.]